MKVEAEQPAVADFDPPIPRPVCEISNPSHGLIDTEKPLSPTAVEDPDRAFPDGGLRAWATIVGAWLAGESP